MFQDTYQIEN